MITLRIVYKSAEEDAPAVGLVNYQIFPRLAFF
jgi:hypothetical protein